MLKINRWKIVKKTYFKKISNTLKKYRKDIFKGKDGSKENFGSESRDIHNTTSSDSEKSAKQKDDRKESFGSNSSDTPNTASSDFEKSNIILDFLENSLLKNMDSSEVMKVSNKDLVDLIEIEKSYNF
jgi:hypothetical protein